MVLPVPPTAPVRAAPEACGRAAAPRCRRPATRCVSL